MTWGIVVGIFGNVATTALRAIYELPAFAPTPLSVTVSTLSAISVPALSLGYVCAIILAYESTAWQVRLRPFGAVGRTALTNYLLQSILGTTIFYSYGLGWFGRVGPALLLIATVVVFAIQVAFSAWWLSRWRFGPMEWLWRSLTYRKRQPLARTACARYPFLFAQTPIAYGRTSCALRSGSKLSTARVAPTG
jgi:uncharacterized protein